MLDTITQRNAVLAAIEKARNSSLIAYFLHDNAMIADDALPQLYDKLQMIGRRERIDLLLYARGGITEVAWRVLNLLRDFCDHLGVIVGTRVQGPGALLALGADEIVMGPLSELGGVESLHKHPLLPKDESGQPLPVTLGQIKALLGLMESPGGAREAKGSEKEDEENKQPRAISLLPDLFSYIHPLALANLQEAGLLSKDVSRKALMMHMHPEDEGRIERIVAMFNGGFHSPLYTASRPELLEAGLPITEPDKELWSQIWGLAQLYQAAIYSDRPDTGTHGAFYRYVCIIESMGRTTGLRQTFTQSEGQERVLKIQWETAIKGPGPGPSFGPGGVSNN